MKKINEKKGAIIINHFDPPERQNLYLYTFRDPIKYIGSLHFILYAISCDRTLFLPPHA
jgi:hypothetical protein